MIKNTRAEIPIVILVLGVLLVCVLALVNFQFFGNKAAYQILEKVAGVENCLSYIEQYDFYKNKGYSLPIIKELPSFKDKINFINGKDYLVCNSEGLNISYPLS